MVEKSIAGTGSKWPATLLALVLGVLAWSCVKPFDGLTWLMEAAPVLIALPLLAVTHKRFPLTPLLYGLIALHAVLLLVGAHYTYAQVPLFSWIQETFGHERNHFDRVGHFMQGFVPALFVRELLLRTSPLKPGKWLFTIVVFGCLGFSALYELSEWLAAVVLGESAEAFLGTQGDVWDTQWDMFLAGVGAISSLLLLSRVHDRALKPLK
jgi:putative membrane protein